MSDSWSVIYEGYDPAHEGVRETLCTLGNGYLCARGAAPDRDADDIHYPGTYLAGGYNRLVSQVAETDVENEDLVNIPNWLPVRLRVAGGQWLSPTALEPIHYTQRLDLRQGVLTRTFRFRDEAGRTTRWEERRFVSMDDRHLCALEVTVTAEDWEGEIDVRAGIDASVINDGVPRYRVLDQRHLEVLGVDQPEDEVVRARVRTRQSRLEIAVASRARITVDGTVATVARRTAQEAGRIDQDLSFSLARGASARLEKIVAIHTSRDVAITEPAMAATARVRDAEDFETCLTAHRMAWDRLWEDCGVEFETRANGDAEMKLRLHIFHVLQTASRHSIDRDIGIPPRGWTGEAYRGHVMWDEIFILPFMNFSEPTISRAVLLHRYRRLPAARAAARSAGYRGAMFPWQSGSDGREESQKVHLNPMSGRWFPDNSYRQRHVSAAIAYNLWLYHEATEDRQFLAHHGAELMLEIARFWASAADFDPASGRYSIRGVMGPDEFHTAYPDRDPTTAGGIDNNAYTNFMAAWTLTRALDVLEMLPQAARRTLRARLELDDDEIQLFEDVSRNLMIPFNAEGIISQFEGFERLKDLDWDHYADKYGDIQRLDRILETEQDDPNEYQVAKQADVLMLFYLFSAEQLTEVFERLGYAFPPESIPRTIAYYDKRTSHGSSLSLVTSAWITARTNRSASWDVLMRALDCDFADMQGGTTREGIHLGAMAGTIDLVQRCFTGIEARSGTLSFNPRLPKELLSLRTAIRFRGHTLDLEVTQDSLTVSCRVSAGHPLTVSYRGHTRRIGPGQSCHFRLIHARKAPPCAPAQLATGDD